MLVINRLTKSYGGFKALDGLNLEIGKGHLFGFVGPNGAGKTTTMKIIAGLLKADAGEILLEGRNILDNQKYLKQVVGYMPDFFGVYDNLKVIEYMEFFASIYEIDRKVARQRIQKLLDLVGLSDRVEQYVDGLSRGMKQKLCLARTMIHEPKLLVLDEPASGMEPRARVEMQEVLRNLSSLGTTIVISSHVLSELADMCSHIGIIEKGKIVISGSLEEITKKQCSSIPIIMQISGGMESAIKLLKSNSFVSNVAIKEASISISFMGTAEEGADLLAALIMAGVRISEFKKLEDNLESIFLKLTE